MLSAGRLTDDQNVDVLLEALDRVARRYDATLGVIEDALQASALRERVASLDHADRVYFLGFLKCTRTCLATRVFASPSVREGFGITFLEALAAHCTVVAAEAPNSAASEIIGDAGFVVDHTVSGAADTLDVHLAVSVRRRVRQSVPHDSTGMSLHRRLMRSIAGQSPSSRNGEPR